MKRTIALLVVVCLSLLTLVGCGSETDSTGTTTGATTASQQGTTTGAATSGGTTVADGNGGTTAGTTTGTTASGAQTPAQAAMSTYTTHTASLAKLAEGNAVRIDGRTVTKGNELFFEWTASGFVMEGELEGDVVATIRSNASQALRVWVDGKDAGLVIMKDGEQAYTLAKGLKKGKHTVRVAKTTEAYSGVTVIDVSFTGKLSTPKTLKRKIEFFGDSITAGTDLFIDAATPAETQDGTKTYAALTAEALDADYRVVALGGWGCLGGVAGEWQNIPSMFERASYADSGVKWDTAQWQPDVVVINLGTNDGGFMWANNKTDLDFEASAKDFLKLIRSKYPKAHIIWTYGMMGNGLENLLLNVMEDTQSTDSKVHYVPLPMTVRGSGVHPGYEDSEICSAILEDYIKKITGWK